MKDYLPDQVPVNETLPHLYLTQKDSGLTQEQWDSIWSLELRMERGEYPVLKIGLGDSYNTVVWYRAKSAEKGWEKV